ncbi:RNA polymerase sigma factor [Evansella sp. AB-rgal1]|uniref:RNA polymerase sigma factor n=1 Tax=Evansella sp. AB-rgal1 TaxID=3242696 RepID=UPI00359DBF99
MRAREEGREISDEVLIKQVLRGQEHAFRILIEKYRNHIYKSIYSVLRNEKDAEDATQEVFIKIYYSLPKYEGKGLITWMTRIAVNYSIDMKRKQGRRREEIDGDVGLKINSTNEETTEDTFIRKEMSCRVREKIEEMPENYRTVVFGYYIEEKSFQQMAEEQRVKEKSIRVKLHRARKWMREQWKEDDFI